MLGGLYGPGMHDYILAEIELGERAALWLESENDGYGWSALWDLMYERDESGQPSLYDDDDPFWLGDVG